LVQVFEERPALGLTNDTPAPANYFDWKRRNHVFSDMAAGAGDIFTITGTGHPEEVDGARIASNLMSLLGVQPVLGRSFTADEDKPGAAVVLISAGLWQQQYGSDPHIIGRTIHLNGMPYRIVGVMPFGFTFPQRSALWVPLALTTADKLERDSHFLWVYGCFGPESRFNLRGGTCPTFRFNWSTNIRRLIAGWALLSSRCGSNCLAGHAWRF